MGWFDKVGDAFNWIKGTAAPAIGGALAAAQHTVDSNPVTGTIENAINPIHALVAATAFPGEVATAAHDAIMAPGMAAQGAHNFFYNTPGLGDVSRALDPVQNFVENATGAGVSALGFAYNKGVAPAVSSYEQLANTSDMWTVDGWRKAWGRANGTDGQPGISPGQADIIGIRGSFGDTTPGAATYDMSPDAIQKRADFFQNSWQGKVSSGALDLAMNLTLDPTYAAGKFGKAAALARNTFKDGAEADRVLSIHAGTIDPAMASGRENRLAGRMDKFFRKLDGKTSTEIMMEPVVKEADRSGAFATMFGRINETITDEAERRAAQRNVFGAMLGNQASVQGLKDQHALLANELQRLSDTPIPSDAAASFTWDDHGQGMLNLFNQDVPPEIEAQKDEIERELARLETAVSGSNSVNRVAGTLREQVTYGNQLNQIRGSVLHSGLGNMPIRVIGGLAANRLPGHVSTVDPVSGFEDLRNTLAQSKHLTGDERRGLLDNYVNAATQGDRQKAVRDAEGAIVHATAGAYDLTPEQARKLAEAGNGRRQAILSTLSSRLYSGAPEDKFVPFVDPETGEITVTSTPIMKSQLEDNVGVIDPRQLDAALKEAKQSRLLERITGQLGDDAKNVATSAYNVAGSAQMLASDGLGKLTRVWKDSALMRLAYPLRIQIDSQLRMATHMDTLSYLGALGSGLKAEGKYLLSTPGGDGLSLKNLFKEGDLEGAVTDIVRKAGLREDDIPTVVRSITAKDGGIADLANSMTDAQLARYRATGEWGYLNGDNPAWAQGYTRAVNRQIRNSPTAMRAAQGFSTGELKTFVRTDPAARQEWLNLKSSNGNDIDTWLQNVQAHVDHYLPTAEMKNAVAGEPGRAAQEITPSGLRLHRVDAEGTGLANPAEKPQGLYFSVVRDEKTFENPHARWVRERAGGKIEEHRAYALPDGDPRILTVSSEDGDSGLSALKKLMPSDEFDRLSKVADKGPRILAEDLAKKYPDIDWSRYERTGDMFTALGGVVARERGYAAIHAPANEMTFGLHDPFEEYVALTHEGLAKPTSIPASDGLPGNEVTQADVEKWFPNVDSRMRVHGESYAPTTKSALGDFYEKRRNGWYKFASEAPETAMARAPLYAYAFKRNLSDIVDRHGDSTIDGATMDQYRNTADRLARREVGKILYDTSHTSNLASTFRYVSPFYAAWEDMVKKWGGLFYDKPQAMVRFEQAWHAPNQAGMVVDENGNQVDADGNRFDPNTGRKLDPVKDKYLIGKRELVTVPVGLMPKRLRDAIGIGDLDPATARKRAASLFGIDKSSFNIVFQGNPVWLPGFGPLVQVPVNEMVQHGMIKNADSPIMRALLPMGVSDSSLGDQILPSWARNARAAFMQNGQEYANTRAMLLAQETSRWENGERPTKPTGDEIDNMARNWFILKAATSFASPVSMQPTAKTQFYIDQAHIYKQKYARPQGVLNSYIQKYGLQDGKAKFDTDYPNWQTQYLKDFPQWYDMSLSMSDNQTGIVATDNAVDIARTPFVKGMVRDKPDYGWYFVGAANQYGNTPGSAFSQTAYAQQETMGLRGQAKDTDALAKVEASKGWMQYQTAMTQVNLILKDRGLHSVTQKGAEDLAAWKKSYQDYLMAHNESWKQDFLSTDSGKVSNFLDVAKQAMAANSTFAKQPQNVALGNYMEARGLVQQILKNRQVHSLSDPSNEDVSAAWDGIVSYLVNGNIGFEQIYNRLLQNDDPSKSIPGVSANG